MMMEMLLNARVPGDGQSLDTMHDAFFLVVFSASFMLSLLCYGF
jgi:hypothetical protein